jgi:hypothetical protein
MMLDEHAYRWPDFIGGILIRLADGQLWSFPSPVAPGVTRDGAANGGAFGPDFGVLLEAVWEADDETERLRAELALAIYLLARNYDLGPNDYQELLGWAPGSPELAAGQQAFHDLATTHLQSVPPTLEHAPDQPRTITDKILRAVARLWRGSRAVRLIPAFLSRVGISGGLPHSSRGPGLFRSPGGGSN